MPLIEDKGWAKPASDWPVARSVAAFLLALCVCLAQAADPIPPLDPDFKNRAFEHVRSLAGLGTRLAGTDVEAKGAGYIAEQMKKIGLSVSLEPFQFQLFELEKSRLVLGDEQVDSPGLGFDPYSGVARFTGEPFFLEPAVFQDRAAFAKLNLEGRVVITTRGVNLLRLGYFKTPRIAALVPPEAFERLKNARGREAEIEVAGKTVKVDSANVVGTLSPLKPTNRFVIISAHLDSFNGPGAHDNASGVGVLLELARHLRETARQLPFAVRFVAFGAEELGMLGAKAYLDRHAADLSLCDLLFNIDSVGGKTIYVEGRGGVQGIKGKAQNQFPKDFMDKAAVDPRSRWVLIRREQQLEASNVPEWLREMLTATARELGYDVKLSSGMGSDHQVFAQAGIVATNICISEGMKSHSPEDVPAQVDPASLEKSGRMVAGLLARLAAGMQ
jgi:hypothetical protein